MLPLLTLFQPAVASDAPPPPVVVIHEGRDTTVFDAKRVHVASEAGAHSVSTPLGRIHGPGAMSTTLPQPGQRWLLNETLWVQVLAADDALLEFVVVP